MDGEGTWESKVPVGMRGRFYCMRSKIRAGFAAGKRDLKRCSSHALKTNREPCDLSVLLPACASGPHYLITSALQSQVLLEVVVAGVFVAVVFAGGNIGQ